ncbi:MAG: enolase C-terminal domain-like protein, partial [Thermoleophilaceae bacterium]
FGPARDCLRTAREHGLSAWLSSTLDGPWGIAAALQLAAGQRLPLACGLATLDLFDAQLGSSLPAPANGLMAVPQGPGLGVEVSDGALAEVLIEEIN